MVLVIALIDLVLDTFHFYLDAIPDPLHRFVEFNLRYCLFRNSLLALEVHSPNPGTIGLSAESLQLTLQKSAARMRRGEGNDPVAHRPLEVVPSHAATSL